MEGLSPQFLTIAGVLVAAWSALLLAIIKWFLNNYDKSNKKQLEEHGKDLRRLDRGLLELRAELPEKYVRREDAIREQVVINAKLDALAAKIDVLAQRST